MLHNRKTTPLRTILENCLTHIDQLEANRSSCDYYEKEFQVSIILTINSLFTKYSTQQTPISIRK